MLRLLREALAPAAHPGFISRRRFATALPAGAALAVAGSLVLASEEPAAEQGPHRGGGGGETATAHDVNGASAPLESRFVFFQDPREEFRALFRFDRDLRDQAETVSWYHFTMFAVPLDARPQPILRFEGLEYSYFRRIGDLVYRIHAHNLSFPRDPATGAFVEEILNPVSGQRVKVPTMALLGDPGVLHGPRGYVPLDSPTPDWVPAHVMFRIEGDLIKMDNTRPAPASWPVNFVETSTSAAPRRLFDDPKVTSLPYQTAGFYLFPWPAWTGLGQHPGHMIGAWSGRKLPGIGALPAEFADRARREHPELLAARWSEHDRPLSPVALRALSALG